MEYHASEQLSLAEQSFRSGNVPQAEAILTQILRKDPRNAKANELMGYIAGSREDYAAAARCLHIAAHGKSALPQVWYYLGMANQKLGKHGEAVAAFKRALKMAGDFFEGLHDLGNSLALMGNPKEAITQFDKALTLNPQSWEALTNKGLAMGRLGRKEEEYECYQRALGIEPLQRKVLINIGSVAADLGKFDEAGVWFAKAVERYPDAPEVHNLYGASLQKAMRSNDALARYDRALALDPNYAQAWNNRGIALTAMRRYEEAIANFDRALSLQPDYADAWVSRGMVFNNLKRYDQAVSCFDQAIGLQPKHAGAWSSRGVALNNARRFEDAAQAFSKLLDLAPDYPFAKGRLLYAKLLACDWKKLAPLAASIKADLHAGKKSAEPFGYQAIAESAADLKRCAEIFAADNYPAHAPLFATGTRHSGAKLRIGYVSGEFRDQATSILMVGLLEEHAKDRFEIVAFDNGWDDGSGIRRRIEAAVDTLVDISRLSGIDAAQRVVDKEIDILVNLNGYFGESRQDVFSHKPAPVQVNYLGFPGTIGADYIDYIMADRCVIPDEHQEFYTEKVVYLPHTYQANDAKRNSALRGFSRAELQLPETGFIFCCFNNNYKITPDMFSIWMRLLNKLEGSVLWLLEDNAAASRNLRREAEKRGVSADRLVFAPRMKHDDHVARHRAANLFLDTLPYNAHTTASDALWAGLPVLTCVGNTFPGRVGASLLGAIGLPELVTGSVEEYERRALELALGPDELAKIRLTLAENRLGHPLFDTARFTRNVERAYGAMWESYVSRTGNTAITVCDDSCGPIP